MTTRTRLGRALGVSAVLHFTLAIVGLVLLTSQAANAPADTPPFPTKFVFVASPGPGGGGGGRPGPASPQPLEIPAHRRPVVVPVRTVPVQPAETPPVLDVPVETDAARILSAAGLSVTALAAPGGDGRGTGIGPGRGRGADSGNDSDFGGAFPAGGDVTAPTLVKQVQPLYTSPAMIAKITGVVVLEAVVRADGTVGAVRVVKSLDSKLGLDRAATEAAKQWVFKPGTRRGQAVDVLVTLILEFRLH
ncbi:MAG TPA: energy transducer TonB [Vicinamibacterales bacterium]